MFDPSAKATQAMVVLTPHSVTLAPKERATITLDVACAEMHDGQPGSSDTFTVRSTQATSTVMKLLRAPTFGDASFRVQQFALWTLIENPTTSGYQALGSTFSVFGTGPSDTELSQIATLVKAAGLDPTDYRALR
jgi:hypothetical protein